MFSSFSHFIISGRQALTEDDIREWNQDIQSVLRGNPDLVSCFRGDGSRVFNQDETSLPMGQSSRQVLAPKGVKVRKLNAFPGRLLFPSCIHFTNLTIPVHCTVYVHHYNEL